MIFIAQGSFSHGPPPISFPVTGARRMASAVDATHVQTSGACPDANDWLDQSGDISL